jgi:hypothetical protein
MSSESVGHRSPYFEKVDENPEYEVGKVLSQIGWDGSIPIDLIAICDTYDFEVRFSNIPEMQEIGRMKIVGDGDFHIVINTHETDCLDSFSSIQSVRRRQRFTLAHEIGHCIYKSHTDIELQKDLQNPSNPHSRTYAKQRENQANLFAAHLLIPGEAFKKLVKSVSLRNMGILIQKVSESFDVSIQVAAQQVARLVSFPCITIVFRADGTLLRQPTYSPDFSDTGLSYSRNQNLPQRTLAIKMLNGENPNQLDTRHYKDASIWFPEVPEWKAEKFSVTETSIKTGQYGVVSFLEIEELDD